MGNGHRIQCKKSKRLVNANWEQRPKKSSQVEVLNWNLPLTGWRRCSGYLAKEPVKGNRYALCNSMVAQCDVFSTLYEYYIDY